MNQKMMFKIIGGLLTLLFLVGCATPRPTPTLTLTINEQECTFAGPNTIPNGKFTIKLIINEQKPNESGYALFTLEKGKTIEDVKAWQSTDQPPWVILLDGVHEFSAGMHTYTHDPTQFTYNALYQGGPYYLVCFRANPDTGITNTKIGGPFGPIEVGK
jgi:hypothetical protein